VPEEHGFDELAEGCLFVGVQGGDMVTFVLDPTQDRVRSQTDSVTGVTTTDHYGDDSDSPVWTISTDGTRTRDLLGPGGDLAGSVDQAGTITCDVVDPHGDVVGQIADDTSATPLSFSCSTEYGAPRDTATAYDSYGWVGAKRRSSDDLAGLSLMGVRLYNPATGRFLSVDPVPGGNPNTYIYPTDSITMFDLNGLWGWHSITHFVKKAAKVVTDSAVGRWAQTACGFAWGAVAAACGGVFAVAYAVQGRWSSAASAVVSFAVGAGVESAVARGYSRVKTTSRFARNTFRASSYLHGYAASSAASYLW